MNDNHALNGAIDLYIDGSFNSLLSNFLVEYSFEPGVWSLIEDIEGDINAVRMEIHQTEAALCRFPLTL